MKKLIQLKLYSDPSHAWLRVPKALIRKLDIADRITYFSFISARYVYLEEDQDMSTFYQFANTRGLIWEYSVKHTNKRSHVRKLNRFNFEEFATCI